MPKSLDIALPPFGVKNSFNLHNEVREVSFSTFKSPNHIPSLLPGDLLYENHDRPANILAPLNYSVLPASTTEGLRSKSNLKNEDEAPVEPTHSQRFLTPGKRNLNPLTTDQNTEKELVRSASNIEPEPAAQEPKPRVSFTERLAAKKASRVKSNESSDSCLSNTNEIDQTSAPVMDKKHVQFDLETKQVCHYTPECSEETKVADKSESSSSEDILDLVGDPEFLKPLSDLNCQYPTAFEEKRWEVSFTSFGLNDANGSPVKITTTGVIDTEDCSEMVTRFNSEYCPSPLPVSSCTENSDDAHVPIEHTTISTDQFQSLNHPEVKRDPEVSSELVPESNVNIRPMPEIETNVPTFYENAQNLMTETQSICVPFEDVSTTRNDVTVINLVNSEIQNPSTTVVVDTKPEEDAMSTSHRISMLTVEAQTSEDVEPSELATKSRVPKITRSITRSDSLEYSVMSVQSTPVIVQDLSPSIDPLDSSIEPQNNLLESDKEINLIMKPTSSQLLSLPAPFCRNVVSQPETITPVQIKGNGKDSVHQDDGIDSQTYIDRQIPSRPLEQDWLKLKREMESSLENEKKRMESWFTSEIAQIKKQFENELASERERTANLSRLVESAKSEKEELAKREIVRLEETLANLVEEKTRQVQTRLSSAINESNYVFNRSVDRQDANVQTEEPTTLSRNLSFEKRMSSLDESGTGESNHARNESHSRCESRDSPSVSRRDPQIKCQCDNLQKQVARVEREMQLLKQKNLSFQKNVPTRKKSTPVKAQREPWWLDTDESATSTASSVSDWRYSKSRSRSMTNLHESRDASNGRKSTPIQRARDLLSKSQTPRRAVTACPRYK